MLGRSSKHILNVSSWPLLAVIAMSERSQRIDRRHSQIAVGCHQVNYSGDA